MLVQLKFYCISIVLMLCINVLCCICVCLFKYIVQNIDRRLVQFAAACNFYCICFSFCLYLCICVICILDSLFVFSAFVNSVFMYFVFMYCVLLYCSVVECSGRLVQLMFAAACGRRPKLTSHFIVC